MTIIIKILTYWKRINILCVTHVSVEKCSSGQVLGSGSGHEEI